MAHTKTWLAENWRTNPKDVGIIYLHKISNPRINERLDVHLNEFRNMCKVMKKDLHFPLKTVVMTTFWDEENNREMHKRERELESVGGQQIRGSKPVLVLGEPRFCRFLGTPDSIVAAVNQLFAS